MFRRPLSPFAALLSAADFLFIYFCLCKDKLVLALHSLFSHPSLPLTLLGTDICSLDFYFPECEEIRCLS